MRRPNKSCLELFAEIWTVGALNFGPRTSGVTSWVGNCSVAREVIASPIGLATKMQNKENTTFLALLRQSFALE